MQNNCDERVKSVIEWRLVGETFNEFDWIINQPGQLLLGCDPGDRCPRNPIF